MYALITGTTNGIGKSLTTLLLSKNLKVIGVDRRLNNSFKNKNFLSKKIDILNKKSVFSLIKNLKRKIKFRMFYLKCWN